MILYLVVLNNATEGAMPSLAKKIREEISLISGENFTVKYLGEKLKLPKNKWQSIRLEVRRLRYLQRIEAIGYCDDGISKNYRQINDFDLPKPVGQKKGEKRKASGHHKKIRDYLVTLGDQWFDSRHLTEALSLEGVTVGGFLSYHYHKAKTLNRRGKYHQYEYQVKPESFSSVRKLIGEVADIVFAIMNSGVGPWTNQRIAWLARNKYKAVINSDSVNGVIQRWMSQGDVIRVGVGEYKLKGKHAERPLVSNPKT